jgi:hypothetical protein
MEDDKLDLKDDVAREKTLGSYRVFPDIVHIPLSQSRSTPSNAELTA